MKSKSKLRISFYLKSTKSNLKPVRAIINFGYSEFDVIKEKKVYLPLIYYTSLTLKEDEWDFKNSLPIKKDQVNELMVLEKAVKDCYTLLELKNETITPESLKHSLDVKLKGKNDLDKLRINMVDFMDTYIIDKGEFKAKTNQNYKSLKNRLLEMEKKLGKPINANDVDEDLYKYFINMIQGREGITKSNSVWTYKKDFTSVLNKIALKFKIKVFKPGEELQKKDKINWVDVDKVYFDFEQIQTIIKHKPKDEKMQNVKLILLTLVFSAVRYSDVFKVKPELKYEKDKVSFNYCRFFTKKGGKEVIIPILKPLMKAFLENECQSAYPMKEKDFNELVKILIKDCKLDEEISLVYTDVKGVKRHETKPFNEFVSSHIGRRTFITNLISVIPLPMLSKITTHEFTDKSYDVSINQSVLLKYNKVSLIENASLFYRLLKHVRRDFKDIVTMDLV